ncbi:hypothetical protein F5Y19DRAFT_419174, partial [Xylariaceae sp. FL1651]
MAEKQIEKWSEDEETVTYGWKPPTLAARDGASPHIHNMTVTYSKGTGRMTQAEMTFDGEHDPIDKRSLAKRDSTPITVTSSTKSSLHLQVELVPNVVMLLTVAVGMALSRRPFPAPQTRVRAMRRGNFEPSPDARL